MVAVTTVVAIVVTTVATTVEILVVTTVETTGILVEMAMAMVVGTALVAAVGKTPSTFHLMQVLHQSHTSMGVLCLRKPSTTVSFGGVPSAMLGLQLITPAHTLGDPLVTSLLALSLLALNRPHSSNPLPVLA